MKKYKFLIIILTMLVVLAGCNSQNDDPNEVAKKYFYALIDGDSESFLSCINKDVLESKLAQYEVTYEQFEEHLKKQLKKISEVFKQRGLSKEEFFFDKVDYINKTTVIVKVKMNQHEMPIPLYKSKNRWYIVDNFVDGLLRTIRSSQPKNSTNL